MPKLAALFLVFAGLAPGQVPEYAGLHYCVGAPLAKVELEAAIGTFAKRVAAIDLVETQDRIESLVFRGVGQLHLELQPT